MEYANFEGTIPPGNYGAGTVMVWDHGTYEELTGNPASAFHQGKTPLIMKGRKLKGSGSWSKIPEMMKAADGF